MRARDAEVHYSTKVLAGETPIVVILTEQLFEIKLSFQSTPPLPTLLPARALARLGC